jgi:UDP-N-acetylglucosamine 1-carboxyvinyltransferase
MSAAMLVDGVSTLYNVPRLRDIYTYSNVLRVTGAHVHYDPETRTMHIDASRVGHFEAPYELVKKMRASFYILGALLGRFGRARVSLPGGCAWGPRPVNLHLEGFRALGAEISLDRGYVVARAPASGLRGARIRFEPPSVGATVNVLLAAVLARGTTRLENAAMEPDVVCFGEALNRMGARISGLGTPVLEIEGVPELQPLLAHTPPDRIELGTYMIAAAMTRGRVRLLQAEPAHLGDFLEIFRQTGARVEVGPDWIYVEGPEVIQPVSIQTAVYPGFPTDLQAQWTAMMTQADGDSTVTDTIYFDRFKHVPELLRMGAQIEVVGNRAHIRGRTRLIGAQVMSTDLRGSVSLVLAGLVAEGRTDVLRVYHLDRGYEALEVKLSALGADIRREQYEEFGTVVLPLEEEEQM